jgi:hypothetical protein
MKPVARVDQETIAELNEFLADRTESTDWRDGEVLLIDNWAALHGRADGASHRPGERRMLERVLVREPGNGA